MENTNNTDYGTAFKVSKILFAATLHSKIKIDEAIDVLINSNEFGHRKDLISNVIDRALLKAFEVGNDFSARYLLENKQANLTSNIEKFAELAQGNDALKALVDEYGVSRYQNLFEAVKRVNVSNIDNSEDFNNYIDVANRTENSYMKVITDYINSGASLDVCNGKALSLSVQSGNYMVTKMLIHAGAVADKGDAFIRLVEAGNTEMVSFFCQEGNVDTASKNFALVKAASLGDVNMLETLLANGAYANYNQGEALMTAVTFANKEAVKVLVDYGANIYENNCNAFERCFNLGKLDIIEDVFAPAMKKKIETYDLFAVCNYAKKQMNEAVDPNFTKTITLLKSGLGIVDFKKYANLSNGEVSKLNTAISKQVVDKFEIQQKSNLFTYQSSIKRVQGKKITF